MDVKPIPINQIELSQKEKDLINGDQMDLLYVINANIKAEGYYINKTDDKVYVAQYEDIVYFVCLRNEEGDKDRVYTWFIDTTGQQADDSFIRDHTLLPKECEGSCSILNLIPTKIVDIYTDEKGLCVIVSFKHSNYSMHRNISYLDEIVDVENPIERNGCIIGDTIIDFSETDFYRDAIK